MTCDQAARLSDFARPGVTELDAADIAALERHLADCEACAGQLRIERAWDERVARAMQDVNPAPGRMAAVLGKLRDRRRLWWTVCGLRAAVIGMSVGLAWSLLPGPALDAETVVASAQEQLGNIEGAREWLGRIHPRYQFPPRFQGRYLVSYSKQEICGVRAPVLTFVRSGTVARVAVVNERQFRNVRSWADGRVAENSACAVVVLRDPAAPGVVYIAEVINGPVEPLWGDEDGSVT